MLIDHETLIEWAKDGVKLYRASHMLIKVEPYVHPCFCHEGQDINQVIDDNGGKDAVYAVYNLKADIKVQLAVERPWNL